MKLPIKEVLEMPNEVTVSMEKGMVTIKGPKGEVTRDMREPSIELAVKDNKVTLSCPVATRREKRMINTFCAHVKNMIQGVQEPYVYQLKICSGHFPMNVSLNGGQMIIKNFLGEKHPRTAKLKKGADVKIDGDVITVESVDKEIAGKVASNIELLTSKSNRDLRTFQDGIYMIMKAGKKVGE